ncbi:MAG: CoB--CoM heterodisulfide reductase subunit C [Candidatus Methanogaster sp.]|uniref:CoB--CoM heterodisulfide reductase subunit C n=1 Tax=Candidatus Methanogaster sp. TaxID=3386292 RepID=A0AC61KY76_9EURY|nr:MAG: CoB--CoM heterodisulfide reductase subunit C [ANME-2 cluster archaeon]
MTKSSISDALKDAGIEILTCLQCGTCSGSCPSGRYTEMATRKIVRNACAGTDVLHDPDLWLCTTCYTCQERCPREIKITDAILAIREIAVHEGIMLPAHKKVSQLVLECGHAVPINDIVKEKRRELEMDELPETVHKYPEALSEVQTLLGCCGFDELVAGSHE